ncbi:MAG: SsrA-binding protein SmpB [Chloroflexota bacterium]|nr:SsrA-binding protein SmpB [Chloroflexota bacterium]
MTHTLGASYSPWMATGTASKDEQTKRGADRIVAQNRRAFHEYHILESMETGIVLTGTEIKSIREGKITIGEAYARIEDDELWLVGAHISPYSHGGHANHEPARSRKLLARRAQIRELRESTERKGMTLIPLRVSLRRGRAKVDIGIARGKKLWDKRASDAEREASRDIARALRDRE